MKNKSLALLYLFVFVDLLGYSLFLPILPFYASSLGGTAALIGLLIASNAVAQLVAAPTFGRLSDRYGRRPMLIISVAGTLISFLFLAFSTSLPMLFFSRVLDGILGGDISLARAYIADSTDENDRAKAYGMIGAAFGLGFVIGPALGGAMSNWPAASALVSGIGLSRYAVPALFASLLALINLVTIIIWLPEPLSPERRQAMAASPRTAFSLEALLEALRRPCVGPLLIIRFFYSLSFTLFTANFALYAQNQLGLGDQSTSYILAYVGLLVVLVQGLAIGPLTKHFSEKVLIFRGLALLAASLLIWAFVPNVPLLLIILVPISLAGGILNTTLSSYLSKTVYREEVGGTMGLSSSLESLARIIAPALGGVIIGTIGASALGILGAFVAASMVVYAMRRMLRLPEFPLPGCIEDPAEEVEVPLTQEKIERVLTGGPAPDFALQDTQDRPVSLSDYMGEKHVVLIFNRGFF